MATTGPPYVRYRRGAVVAHALPQHFVANATPPVCYVTGTVTDAHGVDANRLGANSAQPHGPDNRSQRVSQCDHP